MKATLYYSKYSLTYSVLVILVLAVLNISVLNSQYTGGAARERVRGNPTRALRGDQPPYYDTDDLYDYPDYHPLTDISLQWRPQGYIPVKLHPCEQSSCYPATGNLLIGREKQLRASSTCGLYEQQRYCIVSHLKDRKKCFWCDSRPSKIFKPNLNHSISNVVYRYYPGTKQKSWWQSENGKENVSIQLDLEAEFHFTHLIITFKTFRPAAMLIERSYDFGKTWQVYRYFAHNCAESFPGIPERYSQNLTDVICESRYSNVAPLTDGELIFRVLPPNMHIDNPYSEEVQNLLKMTNLRINFTKLHTLGDDLLDKREEIQEKYYYAITDMVVRGSCSCYGHANRCLPLPGMESKPDMVHGRCECTHNTKGSNCEKCEDFFNDLPWRPAIGKLTNACKRCSCNNHATSCHFDPAVYEQSGRISGGVCDGCKHNTMGTNCEQCKPFYYRDPLRDIQDPEVCRQCDCDPHGSLDGGVCDSITDAVNGLEAGRCHCKENVEGRRCDHCKNGFWNFTAENPQGCQACTCDTLGTVDNQGCNVYTGECTCKRYVTGRDCNQCLPEYWGLSDKRDGCQPCDCDPGGSYDNTCDVITGQCKCREHMTGRQCNIPQNQHFTASLDFLLYEAELANASPNCQIVIREPYRDGRQPTWTGTGFVKAPEGSQIEFQIDNIKTSMDYDIAIRYEPTLPDNWNDVTVTIIRPAPVDPQGPCGSTHPSDDIKTITLPSNSRSATVYPPTCLEAGQTYKIRLDFNNYKYGTSSPTASILVDSIVLIPRIETIPWFQGSVPAEARRREFERHRCDIALQNPYQPVSEVCKQYFNSIGAYVFNGAFECQCDKTGSISNECADYGGACLCKPNVVGRRCDRCAPGTYGFGPDGCKACDCNFIGALDNFCNVTTGQCKCRANTYGRECNQCRTGFWNFPNCQRCDCHGHADICDAETGVCIECRDNTQGHHCDYCIEGYYGDPRIGFDIPCRPCHCPGTSATGHSFADRCSLDPDTKDVICECKEGYTGLKCEVCADNYYGNPEVPGGSCQPCDCSGNVDLLVPGNCDPHTGKCLRCLYETTGDHCEICQDGFFRLSELERCQPCTCQFLGTNQTAGPCDRDSGQCKCLPHVIGKDCDRCEENHWKIASGKGCEPCDCDPVGSLSPQCNPYIGQCECKENFGGRQCNECRENFWGNPKEDRCIECRCNLEGSETLQCDRKTGDCICRKGIGGRSCDECARGYLGTAPVCYPCGECFDNWDRILKGHRNKTLDIIDRARNIKKIGATGAYTREFDEMQNQLDEIEQLLNSTTDIDIDSIQDRLRDLDKQLQTVRDEAPDSLLNNVTKDIKLAEIKLSELKNDLQKLIDATNELKQNGTALQEADVQGALNLVKEAKERAAAAAHKADNTQTAVDFAERQCKAAENLVNVTEAELKKLQQENEAALNEIQANITNLYNMLPDLNNFVCGGNSSPENSCDPICGGAGCGSCGESVSCENGAKQQALLALSYANDTEIALKAKEDIAEKFFRNISLLNTEQVKNVAQMAYDEAKKLSNDFNTPVESLNNVRKQIKEFLNQNNSSPEEIRELAEKVLKKDINLTKEEIQTLQKKIQEALETLTNPDKIIAETEDDLRKVQTLKENADQAKKKASDILNTAEAVQEALKNSSNAQPDAESGIADANTNIEKVHELLAKVGNVTEEAHNKTQETSKNIKKLSDDLNDLQNNMRNNELFAQRVIEEANKVHQEANHTNKKANGLLSRYNNAKEILTDRSKVVQDVKITAHELSERVYNLTHKIESTESEIKQLMSNSPDQYLENLEKEIDMLIKKMQEYTNIIDDRSKYYSKSCT